MSSGRRTPARFLALVAVLAAVLVFAEPARAVTRPDTLADRRPVQAGPVEPGFPIDHLGVLWDTGADEHAGHDDAGPEPHGAVRFRHDGDWGPWVRLIEDGADGDGQWASGLMPGGDADAYQVRGVPAGAGDPRAVAINTTDGPEVRVGSTRGDAAGAIASDACKSRAEWGADEDLRFDSDGNEVWPTDFYEVQTLTVHHTATDNDDPDPASTVRAIYRYHAVDKGWGDIGYQYLIDEQGVVYEGRWSDTADRTSSTTDCGAGGDGSEFGHETTDAEGDDDGTPDELVTAGHTGGYNSGNLGVALLGEFTDHPRFGGEPTQTAVDALTSLLTELVDRHGHLDPQGTVDYVNPVNGDTRTVDTISGHRDWTATECPGDNLYGLLPDIRADVAAATDDGDAEPTVSISEPADGATVAGTIDVVADASDDFGVDQVEFFVDGVTLGTDGSDTGPWSVSWDTTAADEGAHTVTATATDTAGQTSSSSIDVTVDNEADTSLAVEGIDPSTLAPGEHGVTISGSGFVEGATVTIEDGRGKTPVVSASTVAGDSTISATVDVDHRSPSGHWDVVVTLPDGSGARCSGCLFVDR